MRAERLPPQRHAFRLSSWCGDLRQRRERAVLVCRSQAWETQERRGLFATDAGVVEDQRLTLLGPQCEVTEGGVWDPAWHMPQ
jgi:hypothetical protein